MSPGYSLEDIAALRAVPPSDRLDGHSLLTKNDPSGKPAWYTFIEANQEIDDSDLIIVPNDDPITGRWLKTNIASGNSSNNGAGNPSLLYIKSSYQQISLGTETDIHFNNPILTTLNGFNDTTFYCRDTGFYRLSVTVDFNYSLDSPDYIFAQIRLSGNLNGEAHLYADTKAFPAAANGQIICLTATMALILRQGNNFAVRAFVSTGRNGTGYFYTQKGRLFIEKLPLVFDVPSVGGSV